MYIAWRGGAIANRRPQRSIANQTMFDEDSPERPITDGGDSNTPDDAQDNEEKKTVMIELSRAEYDQLTEIKEANGFTWKGMLIHAKRNLKQDC